MKDVFIKICGITKPDQAKAISALGVDAIGMILQADSPRKISIEVARSIRKQVPKTTKLVGVVVNSSHEKIQQMVDQIGLDMIQLHGDEDHKFAKRLSLPYIKAIRPQTAEQASDLVESYRTAKAILLDPFVQGQYGGTGRTLDLHLWPTKAEKPLVLAGGLNADNVVERIRLVEPWAVDLNSGLEIEPGYKDLKLVRRTINLIKAL